MENAQQNQINELIIQDYLLVITPSEEVISEVRKFKAIARKLIGYYHSFSSKAHITVNHYFDGKSLLFDLCEPVYRSMTGRIDAFEISINGFDYFENQGIYTIYAKVDLNQVITTRFKRFRQVFGAGVPQTPHITIARGLTQDQFEILWPYFKTQKFESSFYAEKIVVLKTPKRKFDILPMKVKTEFKLRKVI